MAQRRRKAGHSAIADGDEGPLRTCAVTRQQLDPAALIRFVATPDGEILPDPGCKLPGRGVWVTADEKTVNAAVRANSFAKSLKRQVVVPEDLASRVAALLGRRAMDALSMANKAGLVITGFQQVDDALGKGQISILAHGSDAAPGGCDKLDRKFRAVAAASGRDAPIVAELTIEQMSLAIGRPNVVHAALKHGGAAEKFAIEAGRVRRYRSGESLPADGGPPVNKELNG